MADIKAYRPSVNSLSSGQVLEEPYTADMARLVAREMADQLALELVEKGLVAEQVTLHVGYDVANLARPDLVYSGPVKVDRYGRRVPKSAHGSRRLPRFSSSSRLITQAICSIFDDEVDTALLVRRLTLGACHVVPEGSVDEPPEQLELFTDAAEQVRAGRRMSDELAREHRMQQTLVDIKKRFGKNAILKGMNLSDGATMTKRNRRIGGHSA